MLPLVLSSAAMGQQDEFEMANKFYEQRDYESAIRMYRSVLNQGVESAPLHFNLGNAYFKDGDLGRAVLYYMKARRLDPSDVDISHNLEFARRYSRVQMEGVKLNPVSSFFESVVAGYRLDVMAWVSSIFFVMVICLIAVMKALSLSSPVVRIFVVISLTLAVVASSLTTFKYRTDYLTRRAVIVAEEAPVFTGPSEQADQELDAAPGLIVEILGESDGFYNVLFENKRRGWLQKQLVAEI
ncbi:MAG: tetratricopeptide repeat protein [Candidatus Zixiibacteriota bacterium]